MSDVNTVFAAHLRSLRKQRGLTQRQLGAIAGISFATVSMIENRDTGASLHTASALARALGSTLDAMTGAFEDPGDDNGDGL